jgi:hypothetical protein
VRYRLLLVLLLLIPGGLAAQGTPTLEELELAYLSAKNGHDAAVRAWESLNLRFERILAQADSAQTAGELDRYRQILAGTQPLSSELRRLEREIGATATTLTEAREPYLRALDSRVDELLAEVEVTEDPVERESLAANLDVTYRRYQIILRESLEDEPQIELQVLQDITVETGDSPQELRQKANFLDFRADQYQLQQQRIDELLGELTQQQRRSITVNDFIAGIQRHGDTRTPVVPPGVRTVDPPTPGQALPPGSDTLGLTDRPLSLGEQIANLQALRDRLADYIEQVRDRANLLRRRAGGGEWAQ